MLTLTDEGLRAALRLKTENPAHEGKDVRVYLDGKGCDGFTYGVTFDAREPGDWSTEQGGIHLICDPQSLQFLEGSSIDWVDDERGRGFLVDNPNHRKFRGKFFKRSQWQERLTGELP